MKISSAALTASAALCISIALSACNSAQSDWVKATTENSIAAYQNFLSAHPNDKHASEAQAMLIQLQDDQGWQEAQHLGTSAGYQNYLQHFSQGTHASAARDAMTGIERAAAWKNAQNIGTAASTAAFLQKYSAGPEVDQAKAKLKELTGYRMHLASESSEARAQKKLAQLKARLHDQAANLAIMPDAAGKSFEINSSGMTKQDAERNCEELKRKHETCQVVKQ